MAPERIAEFRDAIANHPHFGIGGDALSKILDALEAAQQEIADLKRGGVVVPDDTFMLHLDTQEEKTPRISINSKKIGVGYDLVSGSIDGHFSRRAYDITPYMRHCLDTIGIHPIPANRVLGEGKVAVDREVLELLLRECEDVLDRYASGCQIQAGELRRALDALRAQATQELAP